MKKLILTALMATGFAAGAFAQGQVFADNPNGVGGTGATTGGLVFVGTTPITQDFSFTLLGGSSAGSLSVLLTDTLVGNTAQGDYSFGAVPGQFADQSGNPLTVPTVGGAANGVAFFELQAWLGNSATYAGALAANAGAGQTTVWSQSTGGASAVFPKDLDGMPALIITVPEPTTIALGGLGAAALLLFRRRK